MGRSGIFDSALFQEDVERALMFLDRVRSVLVYPLDGMRKSSETHARLGLGVMGFADLLTRANIAYGSKKSLQVAESIASMMKQKADEWKQKTRVSRSVLTLAPTGGTSLLVGSSFSIEPHFREAHKISPSAHVDMQAAWQKYIDNGVSKTVNLA